MDRKSINILIFLVCISWLQEISSINILLNLCFLVSLLLLKIKIVNRKSVNLDTDHLWYNPTGRTAVSNHVGPQPGDWEKWPERNCSFNASSSIREKNAATCAPTQHPPTSRTFIYWRRVCFEFSFACKSEVPNPNRTGLTGFVFKQKQRANCVNMHKHMCGNTVHAHSSGFSASNTSHKC